MRRVHVHARERARRAAPRLSVGAPGLCGWGRRVARECAARRALSLGDRRQVAARRVAIARGEGARREGGEGRDDVGAGEGRAPRGDLDARERAPRARGGGARVVARGGRVARRLQRVVRRLARVGRAAARGQRWARTHTPARSGHRRSVGAARSVGGWCT
eukprot:4306536-Prymnesium_polylepis.1